MSGACGPAREEALSARERQQLATLRRQAEQLRPDAWRSAGQLWSCVVPIGLCWAVILIVGRAQPVLSVVMAIVSGLCLVRLFGLFHDLAHGSMFESRGLNELLGVLVGVVVLTPFHRWRREHRRHHAAVANLDRRGAGDVPLWTTAEYAQARGWARLRYRVFRWPPFTCLGGGLVLFFLIMRRRSRHGGTAAERAGVHLTSLAAGILLAGLGWALGPALFLLTVVPMYAVLCGTIMWLYNIQHLFPGSYLRRKEQWDYTRGCLEGSSYYRLPTVLRWVSANTGFHHLHHLFPGVPNYWLPRCQRRLEQLDVGRRAPGVGLRESLGVLRWGLYDEDARAFVPMPQRSGAWGAQVPREHEA